MTISAEAQIILHTLHGIATENRAERAARDCVRAFNEQHERTPKDASPADRYKAMERAYRAFELAMPTLDTRPNIRAYIACVARGLQLRVFNSRQAQQRLYMAQVALSATQVRRSSK